MSASGNKWTPVKRPIEVARALAARYGHTLSPVIYTQGVGISGRLRVSALDAGRHDLVPEVVALVEPYVSGAKPMFDDKSAGADLAGVVWANELAERTHDTRHLQVLAQAASRFVPRQTGAPPFPCDPDWRAEDLFFAGTLLGRAYAATGGPEYREILFDFLLSVPTQRADGLFMHARSAPYVWGRGNGFSALGFAEALSYLPEGDPRWKPLQERHREHIAALVKCQADTGMFRQVMDMPASYEELSATCMTGYALARGIRRGWLDAALLPAVQRAWDAASARMGSDGSVRDVCVGTGVQANLQAYLERPTVSGFDDRGGGMALWFATEMEPLMRARPQNPSPGGRRTPTCGGRG